MPRFAPGPYLRTHGVRPSEKTASHIISGLSPQGRPRPANPPWSGGLRTPTMRELASPGHVHPGPSVLRSPPAIMTRPGLRPASPRGRTECVPPRKPLFALSPGSPRKAILPWMALPSEGRAPHARGERSRLTGAYTLWATRPSFAHDNHVMPQFASGLASRTRRARLSEKTALRVISGLAAQGHLPLDRTPLRWGLKRPHKR